MKKLFLTTALIAGLFITAQAQTKPKQKPAAASVPISDTVYALNLAGVEARLVSTKNLITIITQPGDVTPNQRAGAMRIADSLFKIDATWYNKAKTAPKPEPAAVPAKQ